MENLIKYILSGIGLAVAFVALVLIAGLLFSFPVMWLWNGCLVGLVTGITPITSVWKAWGILVLCGILFKSSGGSSSHK